jgi:hypothetical protein
MSAIEGSVTLEDVFAVASAKRVPLAPELAGYLTLEIADAADAGAGDVDARTVFISEEGTVALVRPKSNAAVGDAETSVRHILAKLLEASGSATPALGVAAKRRTPAGLPALVEELEAALIPVNRAAGRRALARLAREVKRVTLGVGRNASVRPGALAARTPSRRDPDDFPEISGYEPPRSRFDDEAITAKRASLAPEADAATDPRRPRGAPAPGQLPKPSAPAPNLRGGGGLPPPPAGSRHLVAPPARRNPGGATAARGGGFDKLLGDDEVENLLATFEVAPVGEKEMSRELKAIAGLEPTPPPPDARTLAELTKDIGKGLPRSLGASASRADDASVDDLLAAANAPSPPPPTATNPARREADPVEDLLALADAGGTTASRPEPAPEPARRAPEPSKREREPSKAASAPRPLSEPRRREPALAAAAAAVVRRDVPTEQTRTRRAREPQAPKATLALLSFALIALLATAGAIWWKAPYVFTGRRKPVAPLATSSAAVPAAMVPKCKVTLSLSDAPAGAEILLRVGQAPVNVERMPVKTRLELVATAEGHAPRRAVVKSDATWEAGPDGKPRIDVPIQLEPSTARPGTVDAWPAAEAGSEVGGVGPPGTVHVISNVTGAEVWLLAGLGPEARIEQLRCDGDIDVLVAGQPPNARKRLRVSEKDIRAAKADAQGAREVAVSAAAAGPASPSGTPR